MLDPINYFLVILGGFGVIWSYRHFTHQQSKHISEFEYAAFSALWGIPVFLLFLLCSDLFGRPDRSYEMMLAMPMLTTPALLIIGVSLGYLGAMIGNRHVTIPNENRDAAPLPDPSPESASSSDQS